jgi:hypothetical protein
MSVRVLNLVVQARGHSDGNDWRIHDTLAILRNPIVGRNSSDLHCYSFIAGDAMNNSLANATSAQAVISALVKSNCAGFSAKHLIVDYAFLTRSHTCAGGDTVL